MEETRRSGGGVRVREVDRLARTLAVPMPRRRALRLLAGSLVAMALSGTRMASGAIVIRSSGECGPDVRACPHSVQGAVGPDKCCGAPARRYTCEGSIYAPICVDTCPDAARQCPSDKKDEDGYSYFTCCPPGEKCVDGDCVACEPGENSCETRGGKHHKCCARNEQCCATTVGTQCCGPQQKCIAPRARSQPKCTCPPRTTKCGSDCCNEKLGQSCCGGTRCCKPSETCIDKSCCPESRACGGNSCCDPGDFCLHKHTGTIFNIPVCVPHCTPGNRCGGQCCGTGYTCDTKRKRCVRS